MLSISAERFIPIWSL